MTLTGLLILLLIAAVCGGIGRAIAGGTQGGCLVATVLGFIGAWIGSGIARHFRLPEPFMLSVGAEHFPVVWSILGAALLVAIVHLIAGRN
jgi:uncharacterized membrane protein YeaQ/YmgE (transglycosylase-associated protein family)